MKKLIKLECPNCRSTLSIKEKREYLFCEYCGSKIILDNENEHIIRNIDEADIKRAETEQLVKLKELELKTQKIEEDKKKFKILLFITAILGLGGIIFWIIGSNADDEGFQVTGAMLGTILAWIWLFWVGSREDKK